MAAMIIRIMAIAALGLLVDAPLRAENLSDLNQLLATKQCLQCDLSGSGLVMSNLSGANLSGANLNRANLSQANLSGANLRGANLSSASLYGANLSGADLSGANLTGTDLRDAYLTNANLLNVSLETAYVEGAVGIPNYAGTPAQFHTWGMNEAAQGNYQTAIDHFNRALNLNSDFAPAYLGRGLAHYRLGDEAQATEDVKIAAQLFEKQDNREGVEAAQNFLGAIAFYRNAANEADKPKGGLGLDRLFGAIGPLLLRFLLP